MGLGGGGRRRTLETFLLSVAKAKSYLMASRPGDDGVCLGFGCGCCELWVGFVSTRAVLDEETVWYEADGVLSLSVRCIPWQKNHPRLYFPASSSGFGCYGVAASAR